jgi:hypothetical protein
VSKYKVDSFPGSIKEKMNKKKRNYKQTLFNTEGLEEIIFLWQLKLLKSRKTLSHNGKL